VTAGDVTMTRETGGYLFNTSGSTRAGIRSDDQNNLTLRAGTDAIKMYVGADSNVGIGTSSPSSYYSTELVVSTSDNGGITLANTNTTHASYIMFADGTSGSDRLRGQIGYDHNNDSMFFGTNATQRINVSSGGDISFYEDTGTTPKLFWDASQQSLGVNTSSPTSGYMLHVGGSSGVHTKVKIEATTATGQAELDLSADPAGVSYLNLGDEDSYNIGRLGYFHSDNSMRFNTNSVERMRIDSSGNVGIGGGPNNWGGMNKTLELIGSSDVQLAIHANSDSLSDGDRIGEVAFLAGTTNTLPNVATIVGRVNGTSENQGQLSFHTRHTDTAGLPAERLRINEQGMFMLNGINEVARLVISQDTQALNMCFLQNTNGTFGGNYFVFTNASGVSTGTINQTGSTTVAYNTSSDYRLKENVNYDFDATTRLKQLKPARFNWIEDETNTIVDGFIAHEVSSIVPEAITGEKDATKDVPNVVLHADGTVKAQGISEEDWTQGKSDGIYANDTTWVASKTIIDAQGIDQSKLVPLLVKTIQELEARIVALETA
jgi:hypothetical protein